MGVDLHQQGPYPVHTVGMQEEELSEVHEQSQRWMDSGAPYHYWEGGSSDRIFTVRI